MGEVALSSWRGRGCGRKALGQGGRPARGGEGVPRFGAAAESWPRRAKGGTEDPARPVPHLSVPVQKAEVVTPDLGGARLTREGQALGMPYRIAMRGEEDEEDQGW